MDAEAELLHTRDLPGVDSHYQFKWQGIDLHGVYMLEHRIAEVSTNRDAPTVLLLPGLFDPFDGDYPATLINRLLIESKVSAVAEIHFRYEEQCGQLKPRAWLEDLRQIFLKSSNPPIVVSHSVNTIYVMVALLIATRKNPNPTVKASLLIGPSVPEHETGTTRWIRDTLENEGMRPRLAEKTGHPFTQQNYRIHRRWYAQSGFKPYFEGLSPGQGRSPITIPVELCYFEQDTLNLLGQWKIHWLLNANIHRKKLAGHHRGLDQTPDAEEMILGFVKRHT